MSPNLFIFLFVHFLPQFFDPKYKEGVDWVQRYPAIKDINQKILTNGSFESKWKISLSSIYI